MIMQHKFVEYIPEEVIEGNIYISVQFATAVHKCCCGCGEEVVTPITPTDWKLIFDGDTISLNPSIGNWSLKCRSHYFIRRNVIQWCSSWSEQQVNTNKLQDKINKDKYFEHSKGEEEPILLIKLWRYLKALITS